MTTTFDPEKYDYPPDILKERIILITGASDGIGKALAVRSAELGARVILHGRNQKKLEAVYDEIEAIDGALRPSIAVMDLMTTDAAGYTSLVKSLDEEFGRLDGIVHNASILGKRHPIEQFEPGEWQQVMHVNLTAPFVMTQMMFPLLRASSDASVIFTTSGVGRVGKAYWGAYSVSKFGTEALSQILAAEHPDSPLRFNCINPGATRTKMRQAAYPAEDRDKLRGPDEILATYIFLLGPDSKGVTGESLDCQQ